MIAAQMTAEISNVNAGVLLKKLLLPNPRFELHDKTSASRPEVESYIAQHFNREYDAQICSFLPMLMTMQCRTNFSSAVGMRLASQSPLFLEQYLDGSIENNIEQATQKSVNRNEIIEIGNLVATQRGASHLMLILIAATLVKTDIKWMAFTATGHVSKILRRLNFKTITLCEADQTRLNQPDEQKQWGEYYSSNPQVLVGDLSQAFELLNKSRMMRYVVKHYDEVIYTLSNYLNRNYL